MTSPRDIIKRLEAAKGRAIVEANADKIAVVRGEDGEMLLAVVPADVAEAYMQACFEALFRSIGEDNG
jgi:hypothetical protein